MNCIATPFTQKESIRVELEPGGNGEVMGFGQNAEGAIKTLTYNGIAFTRMR